MSLSPLDNLALLLGEARRNYIVMQQILQSSINVIDSMGNVHFGAQSHVLNVLAKWCLFNTIRAHRIVRDNPDLLEDKTEGDIFLSATSIAKRVRDVNEHGYEPNARSKPSLHRHDDVSAVLDEMSLIILNPSNVLIGPMNLCEMAPSVDRLLFVVEAQRAPAPNRKGV